MRFKYDFTVSETDLDAFGHVNNANFMRFYERARWEVLNQFGVGLNWILENQIGIVILSAKIEYLRELRAGMKMTIVSEYIQTKDRICEIHQEIIGESGKAHSKAIYVAASFDMKARKMRTFPEKWLEIFKGSEK